MHFLLFNYGNLSFTIKPSIIQHIFDKATSTVNQNHQPRLTSASCSTTLLFFHTRLFVIDLKQTFPNLSNSHFPWTKKATCCWYSALKYLNLSYPNFPQLYFYSRKVYPSNNFIAFASSGSPINTISYRFSEKKN
jgi:hypothetical protein